MNQRGLMSVCLHLPTLELMAVMAQKVTGFMDPVPKTLHEKGVFTHKSPHKN